MTMIGNLKRITRRRPSLLLKEDGPASITKPSPMAVSDTDSEELDSFGSNNEEGKAPSRKKQPPSKRRETKYIPPPSVQDFMRDHGTSKSEDLTRPRPQHNRRASTGGGSSGSFALCPTSKSDIPLLTGLSDEQRARIRRAKARRRNSTNMPAAVTKGRCDSPKKVTATTATTAISTIAKQKGTQKARPRRHSLDYGLSQPLYTIRPENNDPTTTTQHNGGKNKHLSSPSCRRSSFTAAPQDSMRSLETSKTSNSQGTQWSGGSTFTSTGWSVASAPHSPRKKRCPPSLNHFHSTEHGALGGRGAIGDALYGRGGSNRSLNSTGSDSAASFE